MTKLNSRKWQGRVDAAKAREADVRMGRKEAFPPALLFDRAFSRSGSLC